MNKKVFGILLSLLFATALCSELIVPLPAVAAPEEQEQLHYFLNKTGTCFELNNSKCLNVTIISTAKVHIMMTALSGMIDYTIESADGSSSTILTLGNLQPSTTYYMYEDSYLNEFDFTTSSDGSYSYTQDLSELHHIFIQTISGTTFIYENTTLTHDIYGSVQICANNIVLDLNGYSIIGYDTGNGISCGSVTSVTVKNGTIDRFSVGIAPGSGNTIEGNTISNCFIGILNGDYSTITGNTIMNSIAHGIGMLSRRGNRIYGNTLSNNGDDGIFFGISQGGNCIFHNNFFGNEPCQAESWSLVADAWDNGYPSGGNYWCDYSGVDFKCGPLQNVAGKDGLGDTGYAIPDIGRDRYPLMNPWTSTASDEKVEVSKGGQSYSVQLVSNSTITDVIVTNNKLRFDVSGSAGTSAYITVVLPIGLINTNIRVTINGTRIQPIITTNGTHYFVHLAVTFASVYNIDILFALYTLTVTDNIGGLSDVSTQSGWYDECATATLTAPSVTGYLFVYWDVEGTPVSGNPIDVYMDAPHTATANYWLELGFETFVTDSSFNVITRFDTVFTPKDMSKTMFKLASTNPGQFYLNIKITNTWSVTIDTPPVTFTLDRDFRLHGANPIQVWTGYGITGTPIPATVTYTAPTGTVTISGITPGTTLYITIHMEYSPAGGYFPKATMQTWKTAGHAPPNTFTAGYTVTVPGPFPFPITCTSTTTITDPVVALGLED